METITEMLTEQGQDVAKFARFIEARGDKVRSTWGAFDMSGSNSILRLGLADEFIVVVTWKFESEFSPVSMSGRSGHEVVMHAHDTGMTRTWRSGGTLALGDPRDPKHAASVPSDIVGCALGADGILVVTAKRPSGEERKYQLNPE